MSEEALSTADVIHALVTKNEYQQKEILNLKTENNLLRDAGKTYVDELARVNHKLAEEVKTNHYSWKQKHDVAEKNYENACELLDKIRDEHNIDKARLENLRKDYAKQEIAISNLKEDLRYWTNTAKERLEKIVSAQDAQIIISDLQAKSDSDEAKIYELQTKNDGLRIRLISIRNSVELHTKDVS
jgi:hypothetical protein